jgi:hypothetical protein
MSSVFEGNENDENVHIEDDYIISSDDDEEVHCTKEKDVSPIPSIDKDSIVPPSFSDLSNGIYCV